MESILERISAVTGVKGAFLVDRTRVLARRFPAYLTTEALAETAPPVGRVFDIAAKRSIDVARLVLSYEDSRVLVEKIDSSHYLFVWLAPDGDIRALGNLLDASGQDISEALDRAVQASEQGAGGAGGNVASAVEPEMSEGTRVPSPEGSSTWTTAEKVLLREELARYVGPVASLIVDAAMRSVRTRQALVDTLAREIELPQEREAFLRELENIFPRAPSRTSQAE